MFRVSSLFFRQTSKKLLQFRFCTNLTKNNPIENSNKQVENIEENSPQNEFQEYDSLFEQISPENLSKDILKSLFSAKDIEQILKIFGNNKEKINEKNVAFIIRNISSRHYTLYQENIKIIQNNYHFKDLISYIKLNLENFNEPTLTEVLTFYRKMKEAKLSTNLKNEDYLKLYEILDQMIIDKKINPKLCSQIFYEYCILRGNANVPFNYLKDSIADPHLNTYLTPHASSLIFRGITLLKSDRRKYADFAYRLAVHIESGIGTLSIYSQCSLFDRIAFLKLHSTTSHKRSPQILWKLKELIEQNKHSLNEEDVIHVLEGYVNVPHSLDTKLLLYIKNSVLLTISEKPLNLSLKFLVNFVQSMSKQREGIMLSKESLIMIGNELSKRFEAMRSVKLSNVASTIKAFLDHNFKHEKLYDTLYKKILQTPTKEYTMNVCVVMASNFLKQNVKIDEFLERIYLRFKPEIHERHIEGVFRLFYIYSHPTTHDNDTFKEAREYIFQILTEQCKKYPHIAIKIIGNYFTHLKGEYILQLQNWALTEVQNNWESLDIYQRSNYALGYINARRSDSNWASFLYKAFDNLSQTDLAALLTLYENQENKTFWMSDFVFRVIYQSKDCHKVLRKIIDAFNNTAPNFVMTKKGTPNDTIRRIFNSLLSEPLVIEEGIRPVDIFKFNKIIKQIRVESNFPYVLATEYVEQTNFIENHKNNYFTLAEMNEILLETAEKFEDSSHQEEKILRDKAIISLEKLNTIFSEYLENQDVKTITLNLYTKILKNFIFFFKLDPSKNDKVLAGQLMNHFYHKMRNIDPAQHHGTVINASLLFVEAHLSEYYQFDKTRFENIVSIFKTAANATIPLAFLEHLNYFKKNSHHVNFDSIWIFVSIIENLYVNSTIQIYPYIISEYLQFFSSISTRDPATYNKILKDIEKNYEDMKQKNLFDIVGSLSNLRIKHYTLFKEVSKKILKDLPQYSKELPIYMYHYAKIGFTDDWCKDFIQKIVKYLETSNYDFESHPARAAEVLWSMSLYDISSTSLKSTLNIALEKYLKEKVWIKHEFAKQIVNSLYLLYRNQHPLLSEAFSEKAIETLEEEKLKRLIITKEIDGVCDVLEEMGVTYEKNKYVDDVLIADIYIPEQSLGIFYLVDLFVTFGGSEESGYHKMRRKLFGYYEDHLKVAELYNYHWNKLSDLQEKKELLIKLGVVSKI